MDKKVLINTTVIVMFMTMSMTIPLATAQVNDTQKLQEIFKSTDVQKLLAPGERILNVICPSDAGAQGENCQVFEGTKIAGPTDPTANLMSPGDSLLTGICPAVFNDPSECQLFRGTPLTP